MLFVLSPSKTLDFESKPLMNEHTQPQMLAESQTLVKKLRSYTPAKLSKLMDISDKLAKLNVQRYKDFSTPFTAKNARACILAFKGDVYDGVAVENYRKGDYAFAQEHMRILSGLYGLLRPLDLIQPYRLEMGTSLPNPRGKDLYAFWGDRITRAINAELAVQNRKILINLASQEYFAAVQPNKLKGELINVIFKENQKGTPKIIGLFAKKARGMMASHIVQNRLSNVNDIKGFTKAGYSFQPSLSSPNDWIFLR